MRHVATSLTILGILLHVLLGWCTQHAHGNYAQATCPHAAQKNFTKATHAHCRGHSHSHSPANNDTPRDQDQAPIEPEEQPGCDHSDCFFVDGSVAAQKITVPALERLLIAVVEFSASQMPARLTAHATPLFEPPPLAQTARVARCVWLI